jgi:hypothetical protein
VWRYDTILLTELTDWSFHRRNFAHLASSLRGLTDEVVVSFAHIYRKTERNLSLAADQNGFWWRDPSDDEKRALLFELVAIAADNRMRLSLCAQPDLLVEGSSAAHCIDAQRLGDVAAVPVHARTQGNRVGCECAESRDIGAYDTCPHGCVYCYAVSDHTLARQHFQEHDRNSPVLFGDVSAVPSSQRPQLELPVIAEGKELR